MARHSSGDDDADDPGNAGVVGSSSPPRKQQKQKGKDKAQAEKASPRRNRRHTTSTANVSTQGHAAVADGAALTNPSSRIHAARKAAKKSDVVKSTPAASGNPNLNPSAGSSASSRKDKQGQPSGGLRKEKLKKAKKAKKSKAGDKGTVDAHNAVTTESSADSLHASHDRQDHGNTDKDKAKHGRLFGLSLSKKGKKGRPISPFLDVSSAPLQQRQQEQQQQQQLQPQKQQESSLAAPKVKIATSSSAAAQVRGPKHKQGSENDNVVSFAANEHRKIVSFQASAGTEGEAVAADFLSAGVAPAAVSSRELPSSDRGASGRWHASNTTPGESPIISAASASASPMPLPIAFLEVTLSAMIGPVADTLQDQANAKELASQLAGNNSTDTAGSYSQSRKGDVFWTVSLYQASFGSSQDEPFRTSPADPAECANTGDRAHLLRGTAATVVAELADMLPGSQETIPVIVFDETFVFDVVDDSTMLYLALWDQRTWRKRIGGAIAESRARGDPVSLDKILRSRDGRAAALCTCSLPVRARAALLLDSATPLDQVGLAVHGEGQQWMPVSARRDRYQGWLRLELSLQRNLSTSPLDSAASSDKMPFSTHHKSGHDADTSSNQSVADDGSPAYMLNKNGADHSEAVPTASPTCLENVSLQTFAQSVRTTVPTVNGETILRPLGFLDSDYAYFSRLANADAKNAQEPVARLVRQVFCGSIELGDSPPGEDSETVAQQTTQARDAASRILMKIAQSPKVFSLFAAAGGLQLLADSFSRKFMKLLPSDQQDNNRTRQSLESDAVLQRVLLVFSVAMETHGQSTAARRVVQLSAAVVQPLVKVAIRHTNRSIVASACWLLSQLCTEASNSTGGDELEDFASGSDSDEDLHLASLSRGKTEEREAAVFQRENSWWAVTRGEIDFYDTDDTFASADGSDMALRRAIIRNCEDVAVFGGIRPLLRLLHDDFPMEINQAALLALAAIVKLPENRDAVIRADGLRSIVAVLDRSTVTSTEGVDSDDDSNNLIASPSSAREAIHHIAALLLANMCQAPRSGNSTVAQDCVMNLNVLTTLQSSIASTDKPERVQAAMSCLASFCNDDVVKGYVLTRPSLLMSIVALLAPNHRTGIRAEAARCVSYLSCSTKCRQFLASKTRAVALLEHILADCAGDRASTGSIWSVQRERYISATLWALAGLTAEVGAANELTVETLHTLVLLLSRSQLHEPVSWCLAHVAEHGNNAERVLDGGGAAALASVLTGKTSSNPMSSPGAREAARAALISLSASNPGVAKRIAIFVGNALHS